jgi:hypothetical protein
MLSFAQVLTDSFFPPVADDEGNDVRDECLERVYNLHGPKGHKSQIQCQLNDIFLVRLRRAFTRPICSTFKKPPTLKGSNVIRLITRALYITFKFLKGIPPSRSFFNK